MASDFVGPVDQAFSGSRALTQNGQLLGTRQNLDEGGFFQGAGSAVGLGAEPNKAVAVDVNIKSVRGNGDSSDLRAKLKVPASYMKQSTGGRNGEFTSFQGIIFPYTPSITYDVKADYSAQPTVHSNFIQSFYQRSSVGAISVSAKFTVQNEKEAGLYLSAVHLLKSLTKMRTGNDSNPGSPPPICRFSAYGPYMIDNVPVAVTSFRVELPDTVDYFTLGKIQPDPVFGTVAVPIMATFTLNLLPMYSRREMSKFSVGKWLTENAGTDFRKAGYL